MAANNLFQQQASILLTEIVQIIEEKWPLAVNTGHGYLKTICDSYRSIFEETTTTTASANEQLFYSSQLDRVNECNLVHARLKDTTLASLHSLVTRLETIQKNLHSLISMKKGLFDDADSIVVDYDEFRKTLDLVVDGFRTELRLKTHLIDEFVFRSRLDQTSQVALIAMWIHEPYLDELLNAKLTTSIKFYSNKL